jgi:transcription-repair coupling factor (superfamily II helicase)
LEPVTFLKYFKGQEHLDSSSKKAECPPGWKNPPAGTCWLCQNHTGCTRIFKKLKQNMVLLLNDREEAAYFYDDLNNLGLGRFGPVFSIIV